VSLKVLFIVRRYTTGGGMEKYVWELTNSLARQGVDVCVLCESVELPPSIENIQIHQLKPAFPKPRWLAMFRFSGRVSNWIKSQSDGSWIVHSHERSAVHHVTTFHGPPFANVYSKPWWKRISMRAKAWLFLEKRELCADNVQFVLPNSDHIATQLTGYYPCAHNKILAPAYPAVHRNSQSFKKDRHSIVFVGKEWKRKGLEKAVAIAEKLREVHQDLKLVVVGPQPQEIEHLFAHWPGGYELLGWVDAQPILEKSALLIHPAYNEPYGMAIAEASNVGTRIVISDQCGIASQVQANSGQVVDIGESVDTWVSVCLQELENVNPAQMIGDDWKVLAEKHIKLYRKVRL